MEQTVTNRRNNSRKWFRGVYYLLQDALPLQPAITWYVTCDTVVLTVRISKNK